METIESSTETSSTKPSTHIGFPGPDIFSSTVSPFFTVFVVWSGELLTDSLCRVIEFVDLESKASNDLTFGDADTEVEEAAQTAQAKEFIDKFPERYETLIYQKGSNLSGGQRQRVSIARGLVGDPKILILDDSTSALDAKSEALVKAALSKNHEDTTTFIIAQKISSIITADKILVIDKGQLISVGNHEELLNSSDLYKEIYASQIGKEA